MVGSAIDGTLTHVPYAPNSPEEALICKNYKMWISIVDFTFKYCRGKQLLLLC
jgi:hypothetical protein